MLIECIYRIRFEGEQVPYFIKKERSVRPAYDKSKPLQMPALDHHVFVAYPKLMVENLGPINQGLG